MNKNNDPKPFTATIKDGLRLQKEITGYLKASLTHGTDEEGRMFAYTALKSGQFIMTTTKELEEMIDVLFKVKCNQEDPNLLNRRAASIYEKVFEGYKQQ